VTLLGVLVACIMLALIARAFVQSYGERAPANPRIAEWPDDPRLLTVDEVAVELETTPGEVMELIERNAIPFFVVAGFGRFSTQRYRFDRDEIDDWVIG
jgi:excisionase family DNA binding protein